MNLGRGESMNQTIMLKEWRTYRGLSQYKLSERSGVDRNTIIALEAGKQPPRTGTMARLAAALDARPYELVAAPPVLDRNAVMRHDRSRPGS